MAKPMTMGMLARRLRSMARAEAHSSARYPCGVRLHHEHAGKRAALIWAARLAEAAARAAKVKR